MEEGQFGKTKGRIMTRKSAKRPNQILFEFYVRCCVLLTPPRIFKSYGCVRDSLVSMIVPFRPSPLDDPLYFDSKLDSRRMAIRAKKMITLDLINELSKDS